MESLEPNDMRCPVCLKEYNQKAMATAGFKNACPFCRTTIQPLLKSHDGYIHVNWQDLRVLAIYARRWSAMWDPSKVGNQHALKALENILRHLAQYQPPNTASLVPNFEVIHLPPQMAEPAFDESKPLELKPDASGKIVSPFYKRGLPPLQ